MTQAVPANSTIPSFSSLTASRPARTRPAPTELQTAFAILQAHIRAFEQPFEPRIEADACHLEDWANHLDQVLEATRQYARAVISHLDNVTPGGVADEIGFLADAASEIVGALRNAAEGRRLDAAA